MEKQHSRVLKETFNKLKMYLQKKIILRKSLLR